MKLTKREQLVKVTKHLLNCLLLEYDIQGKGDSDKLTDNFTNMIIREVTIRTNLRG